MKLRGRAVAALVAGVLMLGLLLACENSGGGGDPASDPLATAPDAGQWAFTQGDGRGGILTIDEQGKVTAMEYTFGSGDGEITYSKGYGPQVGQWYLEYRICWGDNCYVYKMDLVNQNDGSWKGGMTVDGKDDQSITLTHKI